MPLLHWQHELRQRRLQAAGQRSHVSQWGNGGGVLLRWPDCRRTAACAALLCLRPFQSCLGLCSALPLGGTAAAASTTAAAGFSVHVLVVAASTAALLAAAGLLSWAWWPATWHPALLTWTTELECRTQWQCRSCRLPWPATPGCADVEAAALGSVCAETAAVLAQLVSAVSGSSGAVVRSQRREQPRACVEHT